MVNFPIKLGGLYRLSDPDNAPGHLKGARLVQVTEIHPVLRTKGEVTTIEGPSAGVTLVVCSFWRLMPSNIEEGEE